MSWTTAIFIVLILRNVITDIQVSKLSSRIFSLECKARFRGDI